MVFELEFHMYVITPLRGEITSWSVLGTLYDTWRDDVVAVANTTATITTVDDVNIGSEVNVYCVVAGQWIANGHITYDAVGSIPTIA